jgi:hypothetical protein
MREKTSKCNNYSFYLLIMYGSSYMFRHYIAILSDVFWEMVSRGAVDRILWMGVLCLVALGTLPEDGNMMPKHVVATIHNKLNE